MSGDGTMDSEVLEELRALREDLAQTPARILAQERRRPLPDGTLVP
jgi:hypothetical protein